MINKTLLKNKYGKEKVFIVPYHNTINIPDGFTNIKHDKNIWSKFDSVGKYVYRYDAEGDKTMQQIIPYIIILNKDKNKIFTTKRIGGESRLLNQISIACGGHINEEDGLKQPLFYAAVRELFEEVNINTNSPFEIFGYVRGLESSTNDHLGVAIYVHATGEVSVKEKDNLIGEWMDLDQLVYNYHKLENWSQYIVDFFVSKDKIY